MKRLFFAMIVALLSLGWTASASDTDGNALTVRNSVRSYLSNEGYAPTVDSDGDIKFKAEGKTYYIWFENWGGDVYVYMSATFSVENYNMNQLLRAANAAQNSLKMVRIVVKNDSIIYGIPVCVKGSNASQFTSDFPTFLNILQTARTRVNDNYGN